jgi:hypothetical protein
LRVAAGSSTLGSMVTANRSLPCTIALLASLVVVTVPALAQVDRPLDLRQLPRGRGWWCYPEELTTGGNQLRCERRRRDCERHHAGACVRQPVAYCVSYQGLDLSTSRPFHSLVCMQRQRDCDAVRTRVYNEGRDMQMSACTEAR